MSMLAIASEYKHDVKLKETLQTCNDHKKMVAI